MSAPESVGVELTEAEIRTAYLAEYSHAKVRDRYDADLLMAGFADGARWLAARQAPTVALDVETVRDLQAIAFAIDSTHHFHGTKCTCGFDSHGRARSMTEHITKTVLTKVESLAVYETPGLWREDITKALEGEG